MARPRRPDGKDSGNFVSEWFGRRIFPTVRLDSVAVLSGADRHACPFLTAAQGQRTACWKAPASRGVCTISATSNGTRQDWLACPHRVIHTDIVRQSCERMFGPGAGDIKPVPVSALVHPGPRRDLTAALRRNGRAFVFFQDKLGGEIAIPGSRRTPEMSFDITLVELRPAETGPPLPSRYGLLEVQTMDFHGSYRAAVSALENALDLHGDGFPAILQENQAWAGRGVEGPNIANVFKRTFYQIMIKFQLARGAAAGTVLALPRAVWDSWQPFLGAPEVRADGSGDLTLAGPATGGLNAFICIFDLDASAVATPSDISPVRIEAFIRVSPEQLARHAFREVPRRMLASLSDDDPIMASIRARLARWWPEEDRAETSS